MSSKSTPNFFEQSEEDVLEQNHNKLLKHIGQSDWSIQQKIALACRKLASNGHAETLAGQVTVKAEDNTFWTNPLKGGFGNLTQSRVVRVDENMEVVEGDGIPNPGVRFHLWIYRARSDVGAIVHTHPPYTSALSMTGKQLAVAHMDSTMFYNDCAYLSYYPGVPLANEEGKMISEALGERRAILLSNHGLLTVGKTLEEATYLAIQFERAARVQIMAESIGEIKQIGDKEAQEAHDFVLRDVVFFATFNAWCEQLLREQPDVAD